jgi:hypothetical protein
MTEPKELKDMTWEEAETIYRAFHENVPLEFSTGVEWFSREKPRAFFDFGYRYRIKQTKPSINWDHLKPWIIAIARDEDGQCTGFESMPKISSSYSWIAEGDYYDMKTLASFDPGTCDWKDSLVIRTGHEQD